MLRDTQFVIFKSDSQFSITECGNSGIKQAFMSENGVSGDPTVLVKLSRMVPKDVSIEQFLEWNAGRLIGGNPAFQTQCSTAFQAEN
jgi:hypothetical protein